LDRVFGTPRGLAGLSQPEQTYYAVSGLMGEVYDGGFGDGVVPLERGRRLELMPTADDESHPAWELLDALDKKFYEDPDRLAEKRRVYAISQQLYEGG
jgi:hypothetical protein